MPATIGDILKTKPKLITTMPDVMLHDALELMIQYDYSQLPVLDGEGRPIGIITSDGIVRALHHFGVILREPKDDAIKARQPRVRDVMLREIEICRPDAEVFRVHRQLRDVSSVLVVDAQRHLIGIITGYDTTEYLRQRVQDIVFVQDIEDRLKDYVRLAFRTPDGVVDEDALNTVIADLMPSNSDLSGAFKRALVEYLRLHGDVKTNLDGKLAEQAFQAKLYQKEPAKPLDDLTLGIYITLFLKHGLNRYGQIFPLDRSAIATMLDSIRETRNDLAHLRIDLTARQRDELRHCREWLTYSYAEARAVVLPDQQHSPGDAEPAAASADVESGTAAFVLGASSDVPATATDDEAVPRVDEQTAAGANPYAALGQHLFSLAESRRRITLTFSEIERMIGDELPTSAREYRAWWSNDSSRQPQADQWLSAGWRTDEVDFERQFVSFSRIQGRERNYIDFFAAMFKELHAAIGDGYPLYQPTRVGYYWQSVARVPNESPYAGTTTFSFTRARRPRVDFYIDTGEQVRNKAIFDGLLAHREAIHTAFGGTLDWERMDTKRASRIAIYYDRSTDVHSPPEALAELRTWGVNMLIRLKHAVDEPTREVLAAILAVA
jgi:CBS domain-containing protein